MLQNGYDSTVFIFDFTKLIFITKNKHYSGRSAVEVVRTLERDDKAYGNGGGPIRQYLNWSLNHQRCSVPARDLDLSQTLEDESLALAYLLLLDEYGVGEILATAGAKE